MSNEAKLGSFYTEKAPLLHTEPGCSDPPTRSRCPPLAFPPRPGRGRRPEANLAHSNLVSKHSCSKLLMPLERKIFSRHWLLVCAQEGCFFFPCKIMTPFIFASFDTAPSPHRRINVPS